MLYFIQLIMLLGSRYAMALFFMLSTFYLYYISKLEKKKRIQIFVVSLFFVIFFIGKLEPIIATKKIEKISYSIDDVVNELNIINNRVEIIRIKWELYKIEFLSSCGIESKIAQEDNLVDLNVQVGQSKWTYYDIPLDIVVKD